MNLSGEAAATLYLELPTPAEVWVNGTKGEGPPMKEWTLTSPLLKPDREYSFDVTARWTVDGKTFEYKRNVTLQRGNSTKVRVMSGTEVKS